MSWSTFLPIPTVRHLLAEDCALISQAFTLQGWKKPVQQYENYWQEALAGKREILVAEIESTFAGYLTIVWVSDYAPFSHKGIPEIVDLNVLKKYQGRGIATTLLDAAERQIAKRSPIAGIGVGLTADYGPAQVLYIKRGYVPDGRGVFSHGQSIVYGNLVPMDDDLVLYLTKRLGNIE